MIALSAGGRAAARCSELNPLYDVPYIPTDAAAPRLVGDPGDHLGQVALLLGRVFVGRDAVRRAGAAQVDPDHGIAVVVAQPLVLRPVARGEVVLAVRQRLEDRRGRLRRRPGDTASPPAGCRRPSGSTRARRCPSATRRPRSRLRRRRSALGRRLRERVRRVAVTAGDGRRCEQAVEGGLLGGIDDRLEVGVERSAGERRRWRDRCRAWSAQTGRARRGRSRRSRVTRRCRRGPGRGPARRASRAQPAGSIGRVRHDDDDARARAAWPARRTPASGSSRPTGDAVDRQAMAVAEVGHREHADGVGRPGARRDAVPMPPLYPRQLIPVPEPTAPSTTTGAARRRRARRAAPPGRRRR